MPTIVKMPKWGLTMTTGTVTNWIRNEGDEVSVGDPLLTVETEKAVNDIEAPTDGVLFKIVVPTGDEAAVSAPIAIIAQAGESLSEDEVAALIASSTPAKKTQAVTSEARGERTSQAAARDESGRVNASPAARKLANELGVEITSVEATGPGGRITIDDVERSASNARDDPAAREEMVAAGDGLELAALIAGPGNARPLLFLHGLGGNYGTWQVVLGSLAENHRVIALDLPGHGKSGKPAPGNFDYSVAGLSKAVIHAIDALKIENPIIVGHSLGGAIALHLALELGDRIGGLALIDSAGLGSEINPGLLTLMAGEPGATTARGLLELFYQDQRLVLDRGVDDMAQTQLADGAWPAQQAISKAAFDSGVQKLGLTQRLANVTTPVLVIWGEHDRVIPLKHAPYSLAKLPDATLKIIAGVGHVPQVEAPAAVATALDRFAKSLA